MVTLKYWRHHSENEIEYDDIKSALRSAIYMSNDLYAAIESITLADGTMLHDIEEIERYYEEHYGEYIE